MTVSVLSAFLVWLGVVNLADPVMTDTAEVPVEIINDEILTANNLTYEIVGRRTTTISYEVNTTNAARIHPSDFRAYADMTELWDVTGSIPVTIEVLNHADLLVSNPVSRTATIKIETEPLQKKQFDVGHIRVGTPESGYEPGDLILSPGNITVEGPESLVGQISSVGIEIPVDGANADLNGSAEVLYYDANGNHIDPDERVTSNYDQIEYEQHILRAKEVALDFQTAGEVADGYRFTGVECSVRSVPVVGSRSVLASLNTITIPGDVLNLSGASEDIEVALDLRDYLPEGATLATAAENDIIVTLTVERLEERSYAVEVNESCYVNASEDFRYSASPSTLQIRVRALSEELATLTVGPENVRIDVSGLAEGETTVSPEVTLDRVYEVLSVSECRITVSSLRSTEAVSHETETSAEGPGTGTEEESSHRSRDPRDRRKVESAGDTGERNGGGDKN